MRRGLGRALPVAVLACLLAAASAYAIKAEIGDTFVSATASLQPRALPPQHDAPVTLTTVTRIGTKDGSPPPILQKLVFIVDKHGSIDAEGVPVCTMAKLADTTPSEARKRCAGSLVGEGTGKAVVAMPGQAPVPISSPLSFFNGPKVGGMPSAISGLANDARSLAIARCTASVISQPPLSITWSTRRITSPATKSSLALSRLCVSNCWSSARFFACCSPSIVARCSVHTMFGRFSRTCSRISSPCGVKGNGGIGPVTATAEEKEEA